MSHAVELSPLLDEFRQALEDCEDLYRSCALECVRTNPELAGDAGRDFVRRMIDLQRGLVLRIFVEIGHVDSRWSPEELDLAAILFEHVWRRQLSEKQVRVALSHLLDQQALSWDVLLGPFERLSTFRNWTVQLRSVVVRIANLVAKADGQVAPEEVRQLKWIQSEMERVLERIPVSATGLSDLIKPVGRHAVQPASLGQPPFAGPDSTRKQPPMASEHRSPEELLAEGMAELEKLVGLANIKQEVEGLVNFLKMQKARTAFDLPQTPISLHSVFSGNPGTGKTTVARLYGKLLGAMGVLSRGHLVETDRSGLVAEFAGQTGPRAHKKIDEALDGVLFIDEAYSLVAEDGEDPYGAEALQVLLKRMEDDRDRLVVILAGYPQPLTRMLRSNPGLSSRFSRSFDFPDYTAAELGSIFESLSVRNRYELPSLTRVKLLLGFQHLLAERDEHFGNGRLARNVFEQALGRLANRIAGIAPLTRELLTRLEPGDLVMQNVPETAWQDLESQTRRFRAACPGCESVSRVPHTFLGRQVQCKRCQQSFPMNWGEPVMEEEPVGRREGQPGSPSPTV